jgi:outer membrane lipoprotein carrier protein
MVQPLVWWLLSALTSVSGPSAHGLAARFEARYNRANTLRADFLELYRENGVLRRSEAGTAYFRRKGKMRWEYESPEKNLFLVDGKTAWFYVPSDRTVTRVPARQSSDWRAPLALLAGETKLSRVCARVAMASSEKPERAEDAVLYCAPKGEQKKRETLTAAEQGPEEGDGVFLEIARATGELVRVLIHEGGGVEIEFKFKNWELNPSLPNDLFRFQVPSGVAIVNGDLPSNNGISSN